LPLLHIKTGAVTVLLAAALALGGCASRSRDIGAEIAAAIKAAVPQPVQRETASGAPPTFMGLVSAPPNLPTIGVSGGPSPALAPAPGVITVPPASPSTGSMPLPMPLPIARPCFAGACS
jgi:hypothetical protein